MVDELCWAAITGPVKVEIMTYLDSSANSLDDEESELAAAVGVERGLLLLTRYENEGDVADLWAALDELGRALTTDPDVDVAWCCFVLAVGRRYAAAVSGETGELGHADAAIDYFERALRAEPSPEVKPGAIVVELAATLWARALSSGDDGLVDADGVLAAIRAWDRGVLDADQTRYVQMIEGMALLARFENQAGHAGDLDAAIALIEPAVTCLPADEPFVVEATINLLTALRLRWERDEDGAAVDRAAEIADTVAERADALDPGVIRLRLLRSLLLHQRWTRWRDPRDLDEAVRGARPAADPWAWWDPGGPDEEWPDDVRDSDAPELIRDAAAQLADLLAERGEDRGDPGDLGEAADWYDAVRAVGLGPRDDPWLPPALAANARYQRWQLLGQPDELPAVVASLDAALAADIPIPEICLGLHGTRFLAFRDLRQRALADASISRAELDRRGRSLVDEGEAALHRWPDADIGGRAALALALALALTWPKVADPNELDADRMFALLRIAAQAPEPPPQWRQIIAAVEGVAGVLRSTQGGAFDYGAAAMIEGLGIDDGDPVLRQVLGELLPMSRFMQALRLGNIGPLRVSAEAYGATADDPSNQAPVSADTAGTAATMRMIVLLQRKDYAGAAREAEQALYLWRDLPPDDPSIGILRRLVTLFRSLAGLAKGQPLPAGPLDDDPLLRVLQLTARVLAAARGLDSATEGQNPAQALPALLAELVDAGRALPADHVMAGPTAALVAHAHRVLLAGPYAHLVDLDQALAWSRDAYAVVVRNHYPLWSQVGGSLARLHRLRATRGLPGDDLARGREVGVEALRGRAWLALLQEGADDAMEAAQDAASEAFDVAAWCLADALALPAHARPPVLAQLVRALDSGRGLVLHAATSSQQTAQRLVELGRADLAERWRAWQRQSAPDDPLGRLMTTGDLTFEVLRVLNAAPATGDGADLLDPPDPAEIARALQTSGNDVLLYLVPGREAVSGYAVTVDRAGQVGVVSLEQLREDAAALVSFVQALRVFDDTDDLQPASSWRQALDEVCRWAWDAALSLVLPAVQALSGGSLPRVVVVPVGALTTVPWAGAWRASDGGRRYAVADAVWTMAASARQFCAVAQRPVIRSGDTLVIGNPDGSLPAAGIEAEAVHGAFFPRGRYLGLPSDYAAGAGTADEVLAWLTEPGASRQMLHIACHGVVDADQPTNSYLRLADDQRLVVRDLVRATRSAHTDVGTVMLAACRTSVAGIRHDEALSMGNIFLAAGARSVFASLWRVFDTTTSLFMFMLHYFLREEPGDPAGALRRAQLWMLDDDRRAPEIMPEWLSRRARRLSAREPFAWAGFVHFGVRAEAGDGPRQGS